MSLAVSKREAITPERLAACDVHFVVKKIPTASGTAKHRDRGRGRFLCDGAESLLLIGDHTNVFNSSTYLNDLCREFGFLYAHDLLSGCRMPVTSRGGNLGIPSHPAD